MRCIKTKRLASDNTLINNVNINKNVFGRFFYFASYSDRSIRANTRQRLNFSLKRKARLYAAILSNTHLNTAYKLQLHNNKHTHKYKQTFIIINFTYLHKLIRHLFVCK